MSSPGSFRSKTAQWIIIFFYEKCSGAQAFVQCNAHRGGKVQAADRFGNGDLVGGMLIPG